MPPGGPSPYPPRDPGGCPDFVNKGRPFLQTMRRDCVEEDVINSGDRNEREGVHVSRGMYLRGRRGQLRLSKRIWAERSCALTVGLRPGNIGGRKDINNSKTGPGFASSW